jgi:GTP-binding protein
MTFWRRNRKQVELAIDEADVIIFVVDAEEGITPMDDDAVAKTA